MSSPAAGTLAIQFRGAAGQTSDFLIQPLTKPTFFCYDNIGELIHHDVSVIMSVAGPTTIAFIEVTQMP